MIALDALWLGAWAIALAQPLAPTNSVPPSRSVVTTGAILADHVYTLEIPPRSLLAGAQAEALPAPNGFRVVGALNNPDSGFQGASYRNEATGQVIVVFRGTDTPLGRDGMADLGILGQRGGALVNAAQPFGRTLEAQLADARTLTDSTIRGYGAERTSFAGHSLGGGIAQVESARTGLAANTYNAAGMGDYVARTFPNADVTRIVNHNRGDDVVRDWTNQPGYSYTYPSIDDGVVMRDAKGQLVPGGRITATPLEALVTGRVLDYSSAGANHKIHQFSQALRADPTPTGAATLQSLDRQRIAVPAYTRPVTPASPTKPTTTASPAKSAATALTGTSVAKPSKSCNKVYKTKDGCHPGHDEKAHPGGCRC